MKKDVGYKIVGYILFENTMPILDDIIPTEQKDSESSYYSNKDKQFLQERTNFTKEESNL